MVLVNTQNSKIYSNLKFKYLLEVPRSDCIFGSAREESGKTHLFLIFNEKGRIYKRQGLSGAWTQVRNPAEYCTIRLLVCDTIRYNTAPRYTNHSVPTNPTNLN